MARQSWDLITGLGGNDPDAWYRACAFSYRHIDLGGTYLGSADYKCRWAAKLDPSNQEYAALVTAVHDAVFRAAAKDKEQRDEAIRTAFEVGVTLVVLGLMSDSSGSASISPHREDSNVWPVMNLGMQNESQPRAQHCHFVSRSNPAMIINGSGMIGRGTTMVCD